MSDAMQRARELFTAALARHVEKDHAGAEDLYRQALQLAPGRPSIVFNLGRLMLDEGRLEEAEALFREVVAQAPDHEAYFNLGLALAGRGRFEDALAPYEQAIAQAPEFAPAQAARGWALEQLVRLSEALLCHARSVELAPDNAEYQGSFCRCAGQLAEFDAQAAATHETAVLICLKGGNVDHQQLQQLVLSLLRRRFARLREQMEAADFDWARVAQAAPQELRAFCGDWLLLGALEKISLTDYSSEAFFTGLRRGLLRLVLAGPVDEALAPPVTGIAMLLACQCFLNEYVWDVREDEARQAATLLARVEGGMGGAGLSDLHFAVLGCYQALCQREALAQWLMGGLSRVGTVARRTLQMQVAEPLAEAAIARELPEMAPIHDGTSLAVKAQYEENPYPRWLTLPRVAPLPYIEHVRRDIAPHQPTLAAATQNPQILIAGCGTGRHALLYARAFAGARITAIDLSGASLAYALRKAQEMGVTNVRFLRGDILDLDALEGQFDVVSSIGVLHHMADPEAGLAALLRRLRPQGYLMLGLYSELARRQIVRVRAQIAAQDLPATPEGIRACRAWMRAQPEGEFTRLMRDATDFYSTSMVRDLLFHVQERRYTVPQLRDMLARHKLEFMGFATGHEMRIKALYRENFPKDEAMLDLAQWDALEQDHPDLFRGMYQFWVRPQA
ncbi:MAG TPA: methyltransferase domain-containing protein [Burkholderiales bacterium]